jgi:hypothetical protein
MKRAEDFEFSVPLQGQEKKTHFFGFACALNVGRSMNFLLPGETNTLLGVIVLWTNC